MLKGFLTSLNCTMLKGQINCAQKVSIYGQKQTNKQTNNHITGQLPASLQF